MSADETLHIAEVPFPSGQVRYRYARVLSQDRTRWVRHGWFEAYYESGQLSDQGEYVNGLEEGPWQTFHENGRLAAEGRYHAGARVGRWRFWSDDGVEEPSEENAE